MIFYPLFALSLLLVSAVVAFANEATAPAPDITLKLAPAEVGVIWNALAEQPAKTVIGVMWKLQAQVQAAAMTPPKPSDVKKDDANGKK